jgi:hypothetical protein
MGFSPKLSQLEKMRSSDLPIISKETLYKEIQQYLLKKSYVTESQFTLTAESLTELNDNELVVKIYEIPALRNFLKNFILQIK